MKRKMLAVFFVLVLLTGCTGNIKNGVLLLEEAKYEEAIEAFQTDVKKERNLDEAYRGIGIAYFEMEKFDEAVKYLKLALENEGGETAVLYSMLGASYLQLEEYEEALDAYESALEKEDVTKELEQEIRYNLIAIYEYMGDWETAKELADKYVEAYPDDTRVSKEAEFLETR